MNSPHLRNARRTARGFTFLELVIAMSMAAMLALTLYVSMNVAFRARNTVETQTQAPRRAAIALDLISSDLQASLRPSSRMATPFVGESGMGAGNTLTFTTTAKSGLSRLVRIGTSAQPGSGATPGTTSLVRAEEGGALSSVLTPSNNEAVLVRGVRNLTFRYYDGVSWVDTWDSTAYEDKLPPAVEITIELDLPDPGDATHGYRMSRVVALPHSSLVPEAAADEEAGAAE
jgi:prepilin-type N-terminal cleavage/methylation domain-containing protein